jgi:hypothetical protein
LSEPGSSPTRIAVLFVSSAQFDMTACLARISSPLETTTHSLETRDFPKHEENRRVGGLSRERSVSANRQSKLWALSCTGFSTPQIPFPGNRDGRCGDRFDKLLLSGEAQHLALARPFGRKIEQPGDPHAVRERAFNGRFDEIGGEECE